MVRQCRVCVALLKRSTLVLDHWDDLLHLAVSITTRSVVPSTILKKLSASPKESQLARALRELGRIERSLFMIEWCSSPALRPRCQAGLTKARRHTHEMEFAERWPRG
nr:Tn3 family transposase [Mesorhizobium sp. SARCC-RB16n]